MESSTLLGLVLAAGHGRRMGGPKALLTGPDGRTFLDLVLQGMEGAGPDLLVVVVGPWWTGPEPVGRATTVVNPDPNRGPISSIRCGMGFAGTQWDGMMVALVDHPGVAHETYQALARVHRERPGSIVIPTVDCVEQPRHRRGHPVIFPRWSFEALAGPEADREGARTVVRSNPARVEEVPLGDRGILMDLDTREQYRNFLNGHHGN